MSTVAISVLEPSPAADAALEGLLTEAYVGGGFTGPDVAATMFRAEAVRARGVVLGARDEQGTLLGTVTLVRGGSAASRLAPRGDAELHLLGVRGEARSRGIGRALIERVMDEAAARDLRHLWLWTHPMMTSAQRLYERLGFTRVPGHDFERDGILFQVYRCALPTPEV
jgi:ribosomal protein S18 acetylase RimI-like enzyme